MSLAIVGAGNRGSTYARHAIETGRGRVVAVAEPDRRRRQIMAADHGIPAGRAFTSWEGLAAHPRLADAVVIATQDSDHAEPAVRFAERGYHLLLEKPMAVTEPEACRVVEAARRSGVVLAVCLVLRSTPYARRLRGVLESGVLGDVVTVEHLEPVGWWHHAHSYVRGPWRNAGDSSPMLLAKAVHDMDWINHILGRPPVRVSSFGGLYHFRPEQRPDGATDNCLDCPVEPTCPYSAPRLYLASLGNAERERWPLSTVTEARTPAGVLEALRSGPYGRCVYAGANDVVDHQVVSIEYEGGATASFTMTAFAPLRSRQTRIFGTHGFLEGDGKRLQVIDFRTGDRHTIEGEGDDRGTAGTGHGGGDRGIVDAFLGAVASGERVPGLASPEESLQAHQLAWAAERARHQRTVVDLPPGDRQSTSPEPHTGRRGGTA